MVKKTLLGHIKAINTVAWTHKISAQFMGWEKLREDLVRVKSHAPMKANVYQINFGSE
jgi:hypothetical protein